MIALICDESQRERLFGLLCAFDEVKRYPSGTELAFYLEDGDPCRLAVVAKDSAEGMNDCSYVNGRKTLGATLWITEQKEFIHQSRRMGVAGFLVKLVSDDTLKETVARLFYRAEPGPAPEGRTRMRVKKRSSDTNYLDLPHPAEDIYALTVWRRYCHQRNALCRVYLSPLANCGRRQAAPRAKPSASSLGRHN